VKLSADLGTNEGDRAAVVAPTTAHEEITQAETEALPVGEPPIDRSPLHLDAVASAEFD
jgi:hypothetical protein